MSIHLPITRGKYSLMDQEGDEKEEEKEMNTLLVVEDEN